jgi:hypothetical protein
MAFNGDQELLGAAAKQVGTLRFLGLPLQCGNFCRQHAMLGPQIKESLGKGGERQQSGVQNPVPFRIRNRGMVVPGRLQENHGSVQSSIPISSGAALRVRQGPSEPLKGQSHSSLIGLPHGFASSVSTPWATPLAGDFLNKAVTNVSYFIMMHFWSRLGIWVKLAKTAGAFSLEFTAAVIQLAASVFCHGVQACA